MIHPTSDDGHGVVLRDGSTVVVGGGGPAGSFFAIRALEKGTGAGQGARRSHSREEAGTRPVSIVALLRLRGLQSLRCRHLAGTGNGSAHDQPRDPHSRLILHRRNRVRVHVQGERDRGVPQALGHHLPLAATLTITVTRPDAKAMRQYRHMWLVERDGSTLGWGHSQQPDDAMTDACSGPLG
jgi:hypothetical protein